MRSKPRLFLAAAVLLAAGANAAPAIAGTYTVRQCDYAAGNGFHDFQWQASGSPALAQYAGSGCSEFGLAARNGAVGSEQRYPSGGYGGWFAYAPIGTVITRFSGAFGTIVGCCVNGLAPYAEASAPGSRAYLFQGDLGNDSWYAPSSLRGPVGRGWDAATSGFAAKSVGFYLRCGPGFSCFQQRTGDFRLRGRSFDFTLRDDGPPAVAPSSGTLLADGWLRGVRTLAVAGNDVGGGLTGLSVSFSSGTTLSSPSACTTVAGRYARLRPCPLTRSATWTVDSSKLPDGIWTATVRAADVGGATAQQVRTVRVDNSAPAAPIGPQVAGGDAWRRSGGAVLRWTNPARQHAPIVRAHLRACPAGGGSCMEVARSGEDIDSAALALPRAGEWTVRLLLEDAAGNSDPSHAGPPQRLRYDPDPPTLRFLPIDRSAPARVSVDAHDLSGLTAAGIELRRLDGGGWERLPTVRRGSRLVAEIDDTRRRGDHALRAVASDRAGNRAVAYSGPITLPARAGTRLSGVLLARAARVRRGCRPSRAPRCRRRIMVGRPVVRRRYGSPAAVRGRLTSSTGTALAGRRVAVSLISRDRATSLPAAYTDAAGRIALQIRARRSAVIRLAFAGGPAEQPSERRLALHVPAPSTLAASRRTVRGSQRVVFGGRVRGGALPRRGKLVEIQAHFRRRWRTISAVRTSGSGRWRFAYAFRATWAPATYRLRARVPTEAGYPFAVGTSRPVRVTVLPL